MEQINDRFTFDDVFRQLLNDGCSNEEAREFILNNFSLSALVFQERIENLSYLYISANEKMSKDLLELKEGIVRKILCCTN